jgi:hypothetical protein
MDGIANTLWSIAQIDLQRKDYQMALKRLTTSYEIILKLGRLDGICYVGFDLGVLLCMEGQKEQGIAILRRSEEGFIQLGQKKLTQRVRSKISEFNKQ